MAVVDGGDGDDLWSELGRLRNVLGSLRNVPFARASTLSAVLRAVGSPDLVWVKLETEILTRSSLSGRAPEGAITSPWTQWIGRPSNDLPPRLRHHWKTWWSTGGEQLDDWISLKEPTTVVEVMGINMWFHPRIGRGQGQGPSRWCSETWKVLWEAETRVIGDVWDPVLWVPRAPRDQALALLNRVTEYTRLRIRSMIKVFPDTWKTLFRNAINPTKLETYH
jgi:hypothetical protein